MRTKLRGQNLRRKLLVFGKRLVVRAGLRERSKCKKHKEENRVDTCQGFHSEPVPGLYTLESVAKENPQSDLEEAAERAFAELSPG